MDFQTWKQDLLSRASSGKIKKVDSLDENEINRRIFSEMTAPMWISIIERELKSDQALGCFYCDWMEQSFGLIEKRRCSVSR